MWAPALLALTISGFAAWVEVVGADSRWLAVLGAVIWRHGAIPSGVPFAPGASTHWPNAIAVAELVFHGLQSALGDRGLTLAQLGAVSLAFVVLTRDAMAGGATTKSTVAALLLVALGALPELSIARVQLFSIALFPVPRVW